MLGILLIDKPLFMTSHDVVNAIRKRFGTKRVGHAGTLDPLATGVLVVAVGPATRFLQYLPLEPKVYVADILFGQSSTTYDAEGDKSEQRPVPSNLPAAVEAALPQFRGLIQQMPPLYSAIKVAGKPLYKYARDGKEIERTARTVHISNLEILEYGSNSVKAAITCSGGTYIRSIAHDLGEALGSGGYLTGLIRTQVGKFDLSQTHPLTESSPDRLISLADALPPMPLVHLDEVQTACVREGRAIPVSEPPNTNFAALIEPNGSVFSVAKVVGNLLQPECVIPSGIPDGTA